MKTRIGESTVTVHVEGCIRCGTLWSSDWFPAKDIPVMVNGHASFITLNVCNNCASPEEKATAQATL